MKRILKLKKIKKSNYITKKYSKKKKYTQRSSFWRKNMKQIESPYNTNEFLIENNSSPFLNEEEEDSIIIKPVAIIKFEENINNNNFDLNGFKEEETTIEKSNLIKFK